jgi:hypothetical protein
MGFTTLYYCFWKLDSSSNLETETSNGSNNKVSVVAVPPHVGKKGRNQGKGGNPAMLLLSLSSAPGQNLQLDPAAISLNTNYFSLYYLFAFTC